MATLTVTAMNPNDPYFEWTGLVDRETYEVANVQGDYVTVYLPDGNAKAFHRSWFGYTERSYEQFVARYKLLTVIA